MIHLWSILGGLLFGFGLALSGMTDPNKVLGFLDLFGAWDPTLIFVMGGAVITTAIGFRFILKMNKPLHAKSFYLPLKTHIDKRLIVGSALFGIGWGLYGYCPGPALSSLVYGHIETIGFVAAMLVGMYIEWAYSTRKQG